MMLRPDGRVRPARRLELRGAEDVRRFVQAARRVRSGERHEFVRWEQWALEEANAIDPLVAGQVDLSAPDSGGARE